MERKQKKPLVDTVTEKLNVPFDIAAGVFRVTVTGGRSVTIENHRGILEYEVGRIRVNCGRTVLTVTGENLEISAVSSHDMLISGVVDEISFER